VDAPTFFQIMSAFPTGVAIVTAVDPDGEPRGLTTNSVASVSGNPPMLLVCVDKASRTLPALLAARRFAVNFVSTGRHDLVAAFASKAEDKFVGVAWRPGETGAPVLVEDALAWAECEIAQEIEAGDHWIIVGRVVAGQPPAPEAVPLVYFRRSYGQFSPAR
jgi:3-hydroxy-9,10-secoandrosta-1,3,5(10)-triene-9,17-dione monooxygenase reductase component